MTTKIKKTSEKEIKTPPKKTVAKQASKLPNTREEKVVSSVTSENVVKPQGKATEEVKKIDEKGKMGESEKIVKKPVRITKDKKSEEEREKRIEAAEARAKERERIRKETFFLDILEIAEMCVKKKGWQNIKIEHAIYAAYLAHPEAGSFTQKDLSERFGFHQNSTLNWRYRNDVIKIRDFLVFELARKYTPGVIQNLAQSASSRNPFTGLAQEGLVKLFLQVVEKWSEKTEVEHSGNVDHDIFTMDLPLSQFVKTDKLPKKKGEEEEDDDE